MSDRWEVMSCHGSGETMIHYVKRSDGPIIASCGLGDEGKRNAERIVDEHNRVLGCSRCMGESPWDEEWDELLEGVEVDDDEEERDPWDGRDLPGYDGDAL